MVKPAQSPAPAATGPAATLPALFWEVACRRTTAVALRWKHLGIWNDITTKISERADKSYATQVYVKGTFGATRVEEGKVVEIICDE